MRKDLFLGIDTSCYMTSLACLVDGKIIQYKKPVSVKAGTCGLRQSEALFQHIKNLPELFSSMKNDINFSDFDVKCIATSSKPRSIENSYMPVFLAGESYAKVLSDVLDAPLFFTSHQDGHIMASIYSEKKLSVLCEPFISVHLSGGTSEILLTEFVNNMFETKIIGGTKDLPAGQFIDRIGVLIGREFPCGKYLDYSAINYSGENHIKSKPSVDGGYFNFSGEETKIRRLFTEGKINAEDASFLTMKFVSQTVKKAILNLKEEYKINNVIMAGGVSASEFLKSTFADVPGVFFSSPEFSGDNAVGVCVLGKFYTERIG